MDKLLFFIIKLMTYIIFTLHLQGLLKLRDFYMKKVLLAAGILSVFSTISTSAQASNNLATRICEYISVNDKSRLRSILKQNKVKVRNIFGEIRCNGDNMLIFAAKKQSLDVGEFLIGKMPAKLVTLNIGEITKHSAHLAEDAKERVN